MKRWLRWAALAAVAAALSSGEIGMDIGKLRPVQVVRVSRVDGTVAVQTDTEDAGFGDSLEAALEDMKRTATGKVFLDTADYLLLGENSEEYLPALMEQLRPSCAVCMERGTADMSQVAEFLECHKPTITLMRYRSGETDLPILRTEEGRMTLEP